MAPTAQCRPRLPDSVAARALRHDRPARPLLVSFGPSVAAAAFDVGPRGAATALSGGGSERARLSSVIDGLGSPRPSLHVAAALRDGALRHVVFMPGAAVELAARRLTFSLDGALAAALDPAWLGSPLGRPSDLATELGPEGCARLLRAAVSAAGLFGAARDPGFAGALVELADVATPAPLAPLDGCRIGVDALGGCDLRGYVCAAGLEVGARPGVALLAPRGVARLDAGALRVWTDRGRVRIDLAAPAAIKDGATVIVLGAAALRLGLDAKPARLRPGKDWLAARDPAARDWVAAQPSAAVLRNLSAEGEARPDGAASAMAASDGTVSPPERGLDALRVEGHARGVFLFARLGSSAADGATVAVEWGGERCAFPLAALTGARPRASSAAPVVATGFFPLRAAAREGSMPDDPARISVLDADDRELAAARLPVAPPRQHLSSAELPSSLDEDPAETLARAARALARLVLTAPDAPDPEISALDIGAVPEAPALTLLSPVGEDPDLLRVRAALLAMEPGAGRAALALLHRLDEGAPARIAAAREAAAAFAVPIRLFSVARAAPQACALRAALARCQGPVLLLGAAALPEGPGWLARWSAALAFGRGRGLAGAEVISVHGGPRIEPADAHAGPWRRRLSSTGVGLSAAAAARLAACPVFATDPDAALARLSGEAQARGERARARPDLRVVDYAPAVEIDPGEAALRAALIAVATERDLVPGGEP